MTIYYMLVLLSVGRGSAESGAGTHNVVVASLEVNYCPSVPPTESGVGKCENLRQPSCQGLNTDVISQLTAVASAWPVHQVC